MAGTELETWLARVYTDPALRQRVLADPCAEAERAGLSSNASAELARLDTLGLELAARSFAHKRASKAKRRGVLQRLFTLLRR
jgi:hypothetical protein